MDNETIVNNSRKLKISGCAGTVLSKGSTNLHLQLENNVTIWHEFIILEQFERNIHGILGTDFLQKYGAIINYELFEISFWINNHKITKPIGSSEDKIIKIPGRCEIIKYFEVDSNEDCVVLPEQLCEGNFVASSIATPVNGKIPVKILNTRESEVTLRNFKPKGEKSLKYVTS